MNVFAIRFVHDRDKTLHIGLVSIFLLPARLGRVVIDPGQSGFSDYVIVTESDAPHAWVVQVAGFRDHNKVLSHLMYIEIMRILKQ